MQTLDERCQRLLRIVAFDDRPDYAGLAKDLNMPVGSIGPTRRRCLDKLRSSLGRWPAMNGFDRDPMLDALKRTFEELDPVPSGLTEDSAVALEDLKLEYSTPDGASLAAGSPACAAATTKSSCSSSPRRAT